MLSEEFYKFSKELISTRDQLVEFNKKLLQYFSLRYGYLVDHSPSGLECIYAKRAMQFALEANELDNVIVDLKRIRECIDNELNLIEKLKGSNNE